MKPRDLFLLAALLAAIAAAAILLGGGDEETVAPGPGPAEATGSGPTDPSTPADPRNATVATTADPSAAGGTGTSTAPRTTDTTAASPSSGRIELSIVLAAGLPAITGYTLHLEEAINPNAIKEVVGREPVRRTTGRKNEDPGRSPIYAAITDVPFSEYGYRIWVFVPGVNGSDQFVRCDKSSPYAEATLHLSPPAPFHLRLIDQYRNPIAAKHLVLRPNGWPPGRAFAEMTTDTFGVAIFEGLLAGAWELWFDDALRGEIEVEAPGYVRDDADLGLASKVLTVALGRSLKVETYDAANIGLMDVDLVLTAIDTTERRRFESKSDQTGSWTFLNVTPGRWQLHASGRGHQTRDVPITVEADKDPEPVKVHLVRLR